MKIVWENWMIESHSKGYGYVVKKRRKGRWVIDSYFPELHDAVSGMYSERLRSETSDCIINMLDKSHAALGSSKLLGRMAAIRKDILRGLANGNQ